MNSTAGEFLIAFALAGVLAAIGAIAGFFGGIFFCGLLPGELSQWALIAAPAGALICGVPIFIFTFRKIVFYGNSQK